MGRGQMLDCIHEKRARAWPERARNLDQRFVARIRPEHRMVAKGTLHGGVRTIEEAGDEDIGWRHDHALEGKGTPALVAKLGLKVVEACCLHRRVNEGAEPRAATIGAE